MQVFLNQYLNRQKTNNFTSFGIKKSELGAVNKYVFENCFPLKQKPNIEKFKIIDEFYQSCKNLLKQIIPNDFGGRKAETKIQRKEILKDWYNYVLEENKTYTSAIQLMILSSITKKLKPDEDTFPPILNKEVLADTIYTVQNKLTSEEKILFNFDEEYKINLRKGLFATEKALNENFDGWIIIPSRKQDFENFKVNVDKLRIISHPNWCTKSTYAETYLSKGAFQCTTTFVLN